MCELPAESLSDTEGEEALNVFNVFCSLSRVSSWSDKLKALLTEEELGRVGLCSHFALDCLCESWNMF